MKLSPKEGVNIVVRVVHQGRRIWLVTPIEHWLLDYRRSWHVFHDEDLPANHPGDDVDCSGRFDIAMLDETTIEDYLARAREYVVSTAELAAIVREYVAAERFRSLGDVLPGLIVDFDARRLVNDLPAPWFEKYVPPGWSGVRESVLDELPDEERYWIVDGRDWVNEPVPMSLAGRVLKVLLLVEVVSLVVVLAGVGVAHLQGRELLVPRWGAGAVIAIGLFFMTGPIYSSVEYGEAELAFVGTVTKRSHPWHYWVPIGLIVAMGLGTVVVGAVALVRSW